jgi:uncharacterized cupredoxin-like copper-binding protein
MTTRWTTAGLALAAAAAAGAGSGDDGGGGGTAAAAAMLANGAAAVASGSRVAASASTKVKLGLDDFSITPYLASARPGHVTITVRNNGEKAHELLLVRGRGRLPMKAGRVDEAALERRDRVVGEISGVQPGKSGTRTFVLERGSYMMFCNLPSHYRAGMRGTLVVARAAKGA